MATGIVLVWQFQWVPKRYVSDQTKTTKIILNYNLNYHLIPNYIVSCQLSKHTEISMTIIIFCYMFHDNSYCLPPYYCIVWLDFSNIIRKLLALNGLICYNHIRGGNSPLAEVGNILSWRLIMKYFLRSFSQYLPSADSRRAVVSFWRKNVHNTG